ncbi:MAG: NYN domain-containing protein [Deltaproteobacteria bacterium]|nr:NYN domain-containing protein [Deltaproteobacteria bacterium]
MASQVEIKNMALFCDFENIAIGVKDSKHAKFDIQKVLERLLLKGSIVVKKAYCDWERYKEFKKVMHEAAFELIEIPHVRQSGKNSADIRMVVDALDLCYTKSHVETKVVIGCGVKNSSSDLLIANCDEFIYYDDLVREEEAKKKKSKKTTAKPSPGRKPKKGASKTPETKKQDAVDLVVETVEALIAERGEADKIWGSMVKQALKRRKPGFNESYYGFRSFGQLIEYGQSRGLLELEKDERSGGYIIHLPAHED